MKEAKASLDKMKAEKRLIVRTRQVRLETILRKLGKKDSQFTDLIQLEDQNVKLRHLSINELGEAVMTELASIRSTVTSVDISDKFSPKLKDRLI